MRPHAERVTLMWLHRLGPGTAVPCDPWPRNSEARFRQVAIFRKGWMTSSSLCLHHVCFALASWKYMAVILSRGLSLQWSSWTGYLSPRDFGCGEFPLNAQHRTNELHSPADSSPSSHCVYKKDAGTLNIVSSPTKVPSGLMLCMAIACCQVNKSTRRSVWGRHLTAFLSRRSLGTESKVFRGDETSRKTGLSTISKGTNRLDPLCPGALPETQTECPLQIWRLVTGCTLSATLEILILQVLFHPWGFESMAYYMLNKYSTSVGRQGITLHLCHLLYQVSFNYDNFLNFFF